ncbi:MAG: BON domain-containing protein [Promethearchaeota archaeon]
MVSSDEEIQDDVEDKISKEKTLGLTHIKTSVINGIVTIEGSIQSFWQRARLETITRAVKGVKGIVTKLKINPRSEIIKDLMSESLSNEKLRHIVDAHLSKIECFFGVIGVSFAIIFIILAALVTPGYNPLEDTVSALGTGIAKTLFSIAFVSSGSLTIPFILYLEKTLVGINEFVRRIATTVAVISSVSVALVGILPDPEYPDVFMLFHGTVAINAFIGSAATICLYTFLMMKSKEYKLYHIIVGYATGFELFLLTVTLFNPLVEWIMTVNIMLWIMITSIRLILS